MSLPPNNLSEFHLSHLISSPSSHIKSSGESIVINENKNSDVTFSEEEINELTAKLEHTDDLSVISTALVISAKCPDDRPAAASLRALAYYSMNETFRLGNLGAIAFVNVLRRHLTSSTVALNGCGALIGLVKEPSNKTMLVTLGICSDVINILREHATTREDIAGWATTVILDLADTNDDSRSRLGQAGACEAVLDTVMAMKQSDSVARLCLAAIRNLATAHPQNAALFQKAGLEARLEDLAECAALSDECRLMASTLVEIVRAELTHDSNNGDGTDTSSEMDTSLTTNTSLTQSMLEGHYDSGGYGDNNIIITDVAPSEESQPGFITVMRSGERGSARDRDRSWGDTGIGMGFGCASSSSDNTEEEEEKRTAVNALEKIKNRAKANERKRAEGKAASSSSSGQNTSGGSSGTAVDEESDLESVRAEEEGSPAPSSHGSSKDRDGGGGVSERRNSGSNHRVAGASPRSSTIASSSSARLVEGTPAVSTDVSTTASLQSPLVGTGLANAGTTITTATTTTTTAKRVINRITRQPPAVAAVATSPAATSSASNASSSPPSATLASPHAAPTPTPPLPTVVKRHSSSYSNSSVSSAASSAAHGSSSVSKSDQSAAMHSPPSPPSHHVLKPSSSGQSAVTSKVSSREDAGKDVVSAVETPATQPVSQGSKPRVIRGVATRPSGGSGRATTTRPSQVLPSPTNDENGALKSPSVSLTLSDHGSVSRSGSFNSVEPEERLQKVNEEDNFSHREVTPATVTMKPKVASKVSRPVVEVHQEDLELTVPPAFVEIPSPEEVVARIPTSRRAKSKRDSKVQEAELPSASETTVEPAESDSVPSLSVPENDASEEPDSRIQKTNDHDAQPSHSSPSFDIQRGEGDEEPELDTQLRLAESQLFNMQLTVQDKRRALRGLEQRILQEEEAMQSMQTALKAAEERCDQAVAVADRELAAAKERISQARKKAEEAKLLADRATGEATNIEQELLQQLQAHLASTTTSKPVPKMISAKPAPENGQPERSVGMVADEYCERAATALGAGQVPEALAYLREALNIDPKHHSAILGMATLMQALGESQRAVQFLRHAICQRPRHAHSHYRLGCLYRDMGQQASAIICLHNAVKLTPGNATFRLQLARTLVQEKRLTEALAEFQSVVDVDGSIVQAKVCMGKLLLSTGSNAQAITCFQDILKTDGGNPDALLGAGCALLDRARTYSLANTERDKERLAELADLKSAQRYFHKVLSLGAKAPAEVAVQATKGIDRVNKMILRHSGTS